MQPVIQLDQISRRFGDQIAVDELSLEIQRGEIFGLLGHNGAGKTTTVRLLNGLLVPDHGSMCVLDFDPVTQGAALRRQTGVLTETPSLDERLSAYDNLAIFAAIYGVPRRDVSQRVQDLLTSFGLDKRAYERVGGYSNGMKQRLALARAMLHHPQILFLDEPTAGLDPVVTRYLYELILQLSRQEGKTIILCTHNLTEAQRLCNRAAVLRYGRLIAVGTARELAQEIGAERRVTVTIDPAQREIAVTTLANHRTYPAADPFEGNSRADDQLHIGGIAHDEIPALVARLVEAGVRIYAVEHDEPTLEDVYFALHAGSEPLREAQ